MDRVKRIVLSGQIMALENMYMAGFYTAADVRQEAAALLKQKAQEIGEEELDLRELLELFV